MPDTRLSILLPVHNGLPYLPEAVGSLLAQTFPDFELLAIDDGSTDGTADYLEQLSDPRIRYVRLEKAGLVGALNYGLAQANYSLIARMDADDIAEPRRLELQRNYMSLHPGCVLLGCNFDEIDIHGKRMDVNEYPMTSDRPLRWQMLFATPFLHPGVMFRAAAVRSVGGYRSIYDVAEDFDLWVRLAKVGELAALPERLMRKRMHPSAVSIVHRRKGLLQSKEIAVAHAGNAFPELIPELAGALYWFYQTGEKLPQIAIASLLAAFETACRSPELTSDSELRAAIDAARRKLRWRCRCQLGQDWRSPLRVTSWLKAMRGFEPKAGGVWSGLTRVLRRQFARGAKVGSGAVSPENKRGIE